MTAAQPAPFFLSGGPIGALMLHGYTGSPPEMRPIGEYLNQRGITVSVPLLPGHGTTPEDLNRCSWQDWAGHAESALDDLQARCEHVFVAGLSMGSLLTLHLAATRSDLAGAVAYSPALFFYDWRVPLVPLGKHLIRQPRKPPEVLVDPQASSRLWAYAVAPTAAFHEVMKLGRQVRRRLADIRCPLLIIHSSLDSSVRPRGAHLVHQSVSSQDKQLVMLHKSGHALTVDAEWQSVAERTYQFIAQRSPERGRV